MKKLVLTLAAICCLSLGASAQRYGYADVPARSPMALTQLDLHLGEGLGQGAGIMAGADLAFLHRFSPAFALGAGFGLDYFKALDVMVINNGTKEPEYWGELTLPLFARGRYTFGRRGMVGREYSYRHANYYGDRYTPREGTHIFMQYDLGYRFCLTALDFDDGVSGFTRGNIHGLFFEPQVGVSVGRNASVSIGLPFQGYTKCTSDKAIGPTPSENSLPESISVKYESERKVLVAAVAHLTISW